ncbi:MAG: hypothetical protein ACYST6_13005 [Planctomycetota bacterium]
MCEKAESEVFLLVVQAVVVNVVDYEMVGGVGDLTVHFDAFSVLFSNSVVILICTFCEPGKPAEVRVVFGIDDGELSAGERDEAWCAAFAVGVA